MIKQQTDARVREVTNEDLATIDGAISAHEGLGRFLYTTRRILGEIGKLDQQYHGIKASLAVVEQQCEQVNVQLEGVKAELAKVQQQEVETRQRLATLTAAAAEKERELSAYSTAVDRIMGKAAA